MLVITRGYIKSPRNIWMWCAKSKTGHWPSPVGLRYIKPCKTWFNKTRIVYTILGKISWLKLDGTYPNVVLLVVYVIFFNGRSNGCWFVYKGTTYIPKEIKPWWNIVQIRNLLDFLVQLLPARCLFFFCYPEPSECLTIMIHGEPRSTTHVINRPSFLASIPFVKIRSPFCSPFYVLVCNVMLCPEMEYTP